LSGSFKGLKVVVSTFISHLLFVDDVLILGAGKLEYWMTLNSILSKFCSATGMIINQHKSVFLVQNIDPNLQQNLKAIFNIKIVSIDQGMKYLGFNLKPNSYKVSDWMWILKKIEKRIGNWTFRWLSLGGRLTLATSVLQSIPVYWLSLVKFPTSVLNRIHNLISKFIWKGGKKGTGFHLTKWKNIARPKLFGGWGIKHISWFAQSLSAKSCWRGLFGTGLWSTVLCKKYLKGIDLISWLRRDSHPTQGSSIIWKNFMGSLSIIKRWLAWEIGSGTRVVLGRDPFIGCNPNFKLTTSLLQVLNNSNIHSLAQAVNSMDTGNSHYWLESAQIRLVDITQNRMGQLHFFSKI
jgi:hypothetical protein